MSARGQKQTCRFERTMSAIPLKADIVGRNGYVRFVPKADIDVRPDHDRFASKADVG